MFYFIEYWILMMHEVIGNTKLTPLFKNLFFFFMALKKAETSFGMSWNKVSFSLRRVIDNIFCETNFC